MRSHDYILESFYYNAETFFDSGFDISNNISSKMLDESPIHSQISTGRPLIRYNG